MSSSRIGFRPDIQGLRAVAIALVVLSHAKVPGFDGGFVGVDERLSTGEIRYGTFLVRRLRRLLAAMVVMLVVILVTGSVLLTAFEMRMQAGSFAYAATWTSNLFFAFSERDYFLALQTKDLFLHTWSLGVEEQFYLIWPWIILLFTGSAFESAEKVILVALWVVFMTLSASVGLQKFVFGTNANQIAKNAVDPRLDAPVEIYKLGSGCDLWYRNADLVPCGIGVIDGKYVAVLLGDSIAAQWSTMISGVFSAPDWQVIVLTKSACAIVDEDYYYEKVGGTYEVCTEWRNSALEYIADIEPDVVVVGSSATYEFSKSQWVDGSSRIMDRLSRVTDHVIVIPGTPRLSFDGPSCVEDPYRFSFRLIGGGRECEETESDSLRVEVTSYLADVAKKFSNIVLLDLSDLICPGGKCAAQSANGIVVFRDGVHITATFAESLIPTVRDRLIVSGVNIHLDRVEQ